MKAVQAYAFGDPDVLRYEEVEQPVPGPGQILIRVEAVSVNYADVARRGGKPYPFPTALPYRPGSEVAGTIAALGESVDGPPVGTSVFALVGAGTEGYAQFVVTPAAQTIPIPPGITAEQAAVLPVAGITGLMIVREIGRLSAGETVLIQGAAGGVGGYAVQIARLLGAGKVIGAVSSPAKFQTVLDLGADHVVDYSQPDWGDQIRTLTDGRGVDLALEMNGVRTFSDTLCALAPFGRVVVYGLASGDPLVFDRESILHFFYDPSLNQSIQVFNLGLWFGMRPAEAGKALGDLIGYVASGQVKVRVHHILPLSQAADAHRMIESRQTTGKVVLKPWNEG